MSIRVSDALQSEIDAEVAAGHAVDSSHLVEQAVKAHLRRLRRLRSSLDTAEATVDAGPSATHDEVWQTLLEGLDDPH